MKGRRRDLDAIRETARAAIEEATSVSIRKRGEPDDEKNTAP